MKVFFGVTSGIVSFSQLTLKLLGNTDVNFGREVDTAKDSGERSSGLLLARHFRRKLMGVRGKKKETIFRKRRSLAHLGDARGGVAPRLHAVGRQLSRNAQTTPPGLPTSQGYLGVVVQFRGQTPPSGRGWEVQGGPSPLDLGSEDGSGARDRRGPVGWPGLVVGLGASAKGIQCGKRRRGTGEV